MIFDSQSYSFTAGKANKTARKRPLRSIKCRKRRICLSGDIEQSKLHPSPFEQSGQYPAFIATEREVFEQDVSVALFELPYQPAFGAVSATEQRSRTDIVREDSQEQGVLAETAEEDITAEQVGTQERVRLPLGHIRRQPLSFHQAVPVAHIRMLAAPM